MFRLFLVFLTASLCAQSQPTNNLVITDDIDLFWQTFDKLELNRNIDSVLTVDYYNRGSAGLRDFIDMKSNGVKNIGRRINQAYKFYQSIRTITNSVKIMKDSILFGMQHLRQIYPKAVIPKVYFVIGALNTGGTVSKNGLLIGTEFYGKSDSTNTTGLNDWIVSNLSYVRFLPEIVMHELIHYQQNQYEFDTSNTLLANSIKEGAADFITYLIYGDTYKIHTKANYLYGFKNETKIWKEFLNDCNTDKTDTWMGQGGHATDPPADLAYFVGFRICQAYYESAQDKTQAIEDIIQIKDYAKFFAMSGYERRFRH